MHSGTAGNVDHRTVEGFGEEWAAFTQEELSPAEHQRLFDQYFSVFPFDQLPDEAEGFDLGCGTGRWAALATPRVGRLHCIDPASKALAVAKRRLGSATNVTFHESDVDHLPQPDASQDFGYSLGVLHHIPDTQAVSEVGRRSISKLPFSARKAATTAIAATIYWPLARTAKLLEHIRFREGPPFWCACGTQTQK